MATLMRGILRGTQIFAAEIDSVVDDLDNIELYIEEGEPIIIFEKDNPPEGFMIVSSC